MYREKSIQTHAGRKAGKVTFFAVVATTLLMFGSFLFGIGQRHGVEVVHADIATTSVNVLNTPPNWTVDAQEQTESSTSTPTNVDSTISWVGTATDGNGEDYYLIICKNNVTPIPAQNAAPECSGGAVNRWAVSTSTKSGTQAIATYTAQDTDPEVNNWYAFVCDANAGVPQCNSQAKTGSGNTASPFHVNHRAGFTIFIDDSPTAPGNVVTWMATASDPDITGGQDTIQLFVCKSNDFTGSACGPAGTWATSTFVLADPVASTTVPIPYPDGATSSYGYIVDEHGLTASTTAPNVQGSDSVLTVANVTPTLTPASIVLASSSDIILTVEAGETPGIQLSATISDNNSCQTSSGGNEISVIEANVYRSGVSSSSCLVAGDYDTNNCYPYAVGNATWNFTCVQRAGTCLGISDTDAVFDCTFPLWFNADPTDAGSQFPAENWLATVRAADDNAATSTWVEASNGQELLQFIAYNVATTSIDYGSLQPGQNNTTTDRQTILEATGNVGLDVSLLGTDMCATYPSCPGAATNTIPVSEQHYATSTVPYASGIALSATGTELEVNVPKTIATNTYATGSVYWGIAVPASITLSGGYTGENTLIGVVGESIAW